MVNTHKLEENKSRAVKRGKQGERTVRPNNERFLNTKNFELQFRAVLKVVGRGYDGGGMWLGNEFIKINDYKIPYYKDVLDGILAQ